MRILHHIQSSIVKDVMCSIQFDTMYEPIQMNILLTHLFGMNSCICLCHQASDSDQTQCNNCHCHSDSRSVCTALHCNLCNDFQQQKKNRFCKLQTNKTPKIEDAEFFRNNWYMHFGGTLSH